ncbi:hypothetical protein [Teichococcus aerofrigidensis]
MRASLHLDLGHGRLLTATARATPAGLIAAAILVSSVLLSAAVLRRISYRAR